MTEPTVKGLASYFPSIEKTYGSPIAEWQRIVREHPATKHMEPVAMLKAEHGMDHGHANAIVAPRCRSLTWPACHARRHVDMYDTRIPPLTSSARSPRRRGRRPVLTA
ncbi:MAG: DUF4287 domain-containing protein [Sphingobium sp.]